MRFNFAKINKKIIRWGEVYEICAIFASLVKHEC